MISHHETSAAFYHLLRKARQTDLNALHPGLSQSEYFVLLMARKAVAMEQEKQAAYVSFLIEKLEVSPQSVSKLLRSLEEKGYIERSVNKADRRNVAVRLTAGGDEALQMAEAALAEFAERIIVKMGEDDMETLLALLKKLFTVLDGELLEYQSIACAEDWHTDAYCSHPAHERRQGYDGIQGK